MTQAHQSRKQAITRILASEWQSTMTIKTRLESHCGLQLDLHSIRETLQELAQEYKANKRAAGHGFEWKRPTKEKQ